MIKISKLLFLLLFMFLIIMPQKILANQKIKIGLLVPLTGNNQEIGQQIIKTVRMAINDIDNDNIEIIVRDTKSNPKFTLRSALELKKENVKLVIGPVFYENVNYLNEVEDGGHTSFNHYGVKIKPETGKTLIWPAEWTHVHAGELLKSGTKYIVTGWMHFPT